MTKCHASRGRTELRVKAASPVSDMPVMRPAGAEDFVLDFRDGPLKVTAFHRLELKA